VLYHLYNFRHRIRDGRDDKREMISRLARGREFLPGTREVRRIFVGFRKPMGM
jgi:hypothetical protein